MVELIIQNAGAGPLVIIIHLCNAIRRKTDFARGTPRIELNDQQG